MIARHFFFVQVSLRDGFTPYDNDMACFTFLSDLSSETESEDSALLPQAAPQSDLLSLESLRQEELAALPCAIFSHRKTALEKRARLRRASHPSPSRPLWANAAPGSAYRSEEHTSELQSQSNLVCRLLLE